MSEENLNLHIDSDWKAKAQQEKQRLRQQEEERKKQQQAEEAAKQAAAAAQSAGPQAGPTGQPGTAPGGARPKMQVSFEALCSLLASQAVLAMGGVPGESSGEAMINLPYARMVIDQLALLEEKTEGNLTQDELDTLKMTLYQLRSHYISVSAAVREK